MAIAIIFILIAISVILFISYQIKREKEERKNYEKNHQKQIKAGHEKQIVTQEDGQTKIDTSQNQA